VFPGLVILCILLVSCGCSGFDERSNVSALDLFCTVPYLTTYFTSPFYYQNNRFPVSSRAGLLRKALDCVSPFPLSFTGFQLSLGLQKVLSLSQWGVKSEKPVRFSKPGSKFLTFLDGAVDFFRFL
jgi:hypothetical protein